MPTVRYYFELNTSVVERFGGYQYLTGEAETPPDGHFPRFNRVGPHTYHQLMSSSDRVIICDGDSVRYAKNRWEDHRCAVVDPEELFLMKVRSVEI
jgi:hypothetical protein